MDILAGQLAFGIVAVADGVAQGVGDGGDLIAAIGVGERAGARLRDIVVRPLFPSVPYFLRQVIAFNCQETLKRVIRILIGK